MFNKISVSVFVLSLFLVGCQGKIIDNSPIHKPYLNPGGIDFERDTEFFKSYNKLEGARKKRCDTAYHAANSPKSEEESLFPGSVLIGEHQSRVLMRSEIKREQNWFEKNCVENRDLPNDLKDMIIDKCNAMSDVIVNPNPSVPIVESSVDLDSLSVIDYSDSSKKSNKTKSVKKSSNSKAKKKKTNKKIDLCMQNDYQVLTLDNIVNNCDKYSDKLGSGERISYRKSINYKKGSGKAKIQNLDLK
jgi:hypothetical protein